MHSNIETESSAVKGAKSGAGVGITGQNPLITIVTVVYNGAEALEQTILSVINQTYDNIEYIIIDGGSSDGTLDVIRKYANAIDYWLSEPDSGIYDAMNKGIRHAHGEWINFMNSGDLFSGPAVLAGISDRLVDANDVVYGDVEIYRHDRHVCMKPSATEVQLPIHGMPACHQSMVIRTKWLKSTPYKTDFDLAADFDHLCHILGHGGKAERVPLIISRVSAGGVSRTNRLDVYSQYEEIFNSHFGRDLFSACYYTWRRMLVRLKTLVSRSRTV